MSPDITMLFNQQLCEYWEIQDLKAKLVKAQTRHLELCTQIQELLGTESIEVSQPSSVDSAAPAPVLPRETGAGFLTQRQAG